jgi:hypothetical protein
MPRGASNLAPAAEGRGEFMNAQLKPTGFPLPSSLRVVPGTVVHGIISEI